MFKSLVMFIDASALCTGPLYVAVIRSSFSLLIGVVTPKGDEKKETLEQGKGRPAVDRLRCIESVASSKREVWTRAYIAPHAERLA